MTEVETSPRPPDLSKHDRDAFNQVVQCVEDSTYCALLGPRFSGKTDLLRLAETMLTREATRICICIDLHKVEASTQTGFFAGLVSATAQRVVQLTGHALPIPAKGVTGSAVFRGFLAEAVTQLDRDLVLMIDHLEALPNDLIRALLTSLRAVYMDQQSQQPRFVAVVSGALSLASLTVGESSPFRDISRHVFMGDLTESQSEALIAEHIASESVEVSQAARAWLLRATRGDPQLIARICQRCLQIAGESSSQRLTAPTVKRVVREFIRDEASRYTPLQEAVRLVEDDPDLLRCILILTVCSMVPIQELPLPLSPDIDPLYLSGLVSRVKGDSYQLRNDVYGQFLRQYFDPGRVGHLLSMAGRWESAIDHLEASVSAGNGQYRSDLLAATVNSMYASRTLKHAAYYLTRGLSAAFGITEARIWYACEGDSSLRLVRQAGSTTASTPPIRRRVSIEEDTLEARAYREAHLLRGQEGDGRVRLAIPLLIRGGRPIGVATVTDCLANSKLDQQRERTRQLLGYLSQAARAFQEVSARVSQAMRIRDQGAQLEEKTRQLSLLHQISTLVQNLTDLEKMLNLVLTGTTAHYGLGFNRAWLFLLNSEHTHLTGRMAIGDFTHEDAFRTWEHAARLSFDEYVRRLLAADAIEHTPIDAPTRQVRIPVSEHSDDVFSAAIFKQCTFRWPASSLDRHLLPPEFQQRFDPEDVIVAPLLTQGECLGIIAADNKFRPRAYTSGDEEMLATFANQAAAAIRMAQLLDEQRYSLERLSRLYEQAAALGKGLDLKSSMEVLIDTLREMFRLDTCTVGLLSPDRTVLEFVAARGIEVLPKVQVSDIPEDLWRRLIEGKSIFIADLQQRPNVQGLLMHPGLKEAGQFVVLPLRGREGVAGVITMGSVEVLSLTKDDWERLLVFAERTTVAIENARLYQASEQRAQQVRRLMKVSEALARQTDLRMALQLIAEVVEETMDYQMVAVCLRGREDEVRLLASAGLTQDEKARLGEDLGAWKEFSAPMQERFRMSHSYFVPQGEYAWDEYKASGFVRDLGARQPGEWHSHDLLRVPLVGTAGQVLGVISVGDPRHRRRPDPVTVQSLELFANHAAAAIERANLYERLQNVVAGTKAISEGITRSPKEVYGQIARRACEVVGADSAVIYPYEAETLRFDVAGWTGHGLLEPEWPLNIKQRVGTGMAASILQEGEVIVEDTSLPAVKGREPLSRQSEFIKREKITAFVGLRLQVGERPVGILYINLRDRPHHFTVEQLAAIRPFADQAALSIRIAQLYEQKRRALEGIAQADQEIVSTLELEEVLARVVEQACVTLDATSAILYPYDARTDVLRKPIFSGTVKHPSVLGKPRGSGTALTRLRASNTAQFADDSSAHPVMAGKFVGRERIASSAGLPLKAADQIMGYLFVNYAEVHHFTEDEKQFFLTLANQAALAIRSATAYEDLEFQATVAGMAAWGAELAHDINREVYQIRSLTDWALQLEGLPDEVQTWLREIDRRAGTLSVVPIPAQPVDQVSEQLAVPLDEALRKWATHYCVRRPDVRARWETRCGRARAAISDWWLGRVMRHLVRNALEAMPEGGTLTIRSRAQKNGCAEVQIEDMGTGVRADVLPDLFRVPTSSRGEGRGFGLIIARFAIERYGGEIWLHRTDQGKGTTFAFTLPLMGEQPV